MDGSSLRCLTIAFGIATPSVHVDYYVFITRACNLRCAYCCFEDSLTRAAQEAEPKLDVEQTARFILRDADAGGDDDNKVFFYGGEPTLEPRWISNFIDLTEGRLRYVIQTNGTLLSKLETDLLRRVHYLEVSIDGDRENNDAMRGAGTYDRVVRNLADIRTRFDGELAARMTYTPRIPLFDSVKMLLEELCFDHVYWMHEDAQTPASDWSSTIEAYAGEIRELISYWMTHLRRGEVKSIIPFRSIVSSILEPPEQPFFRCGTGTYLRVIDNDGRCYPCDLMITDDKRHQLGTIEEGPLALKLPVNDVYDSNCTSCAHLPCCGGRCFNVSLSGDERFNAFCDRTKLLIDELRKAAPEIRRLIEADVIDAGRIHITTTLTEQIP